MTHTPTLANRAGRGGIAGGILLAVAIVAVAGWAAHFIARSSFVAVDGRRYYSLFDDAMIAMRYAWNLAQGDGPVWNPGEPVEGYTSPLMVAWMSIPARFFDKPTAVLAVQIAGIGVLIGIGLITVGVQREVAALATPPRTPLLAASLLLASVAYYPLAYFTLMGMETGWLGLLVTVEVYLAFRYVRVGTATAAASVGVAASLAYLARPDSVVLSVPVLVYLWGAVRERRLRLRGAEHALTAAALLAGVIVAHRWWAYGYYGALLPNTYTLKLAGIPLSLRLGNGTRFVYRYLIQTWPILAIGFIEALFDARREKLLMASLVAIGIGYQVWVGGDPWPYWRMLASTWPMVVVLAVAGLEGLFQTLGASSLAAFLRRRPLLPAQTLLALLGYVAAFVTLASVNDPFKEEILGTRPLYQVDSNLKNVNEAVAILEATTEGASVGSAWAGTIPYYTGLYSVDYLGKSDPIIARLPPDLSGAVSWGGMSSIPGHNKYDLTYSIATRRPTYTQVLLWGHDDMQSLLGPVYIVVYVRFPGRETIPIYLLRDSPFVDWSRVFIP